LSHITTVFFQGHADLLGIGAGVDPTVQSGEMREELFASDTRKPAAIDVAAFRRFAFVIDGEVVVSMKPDEGWATGPAKVDKNRADRFLIRATIRLFSVKPTGPTLTPC